MLNEAVGQRQAARYGKMAHHHASQFECRQCRRPAAIECCNLAQHAQVLGGNEENVESSCGRDRCQHGDAPRGAGNNAMSLFIEARNEVAVGKLDPVGRIDHPGGMFAKS